MGHIEKLKKRRPKLRNGLIQKLPPHPADAIVGKDKRILLYMVQWADEAHKIASTDKEKRIAMAGKLDLMLNGSEVLKGYILGVSAPVFRRYVTTFFSMFEASFDVGGRIPSKNSPYRNMVGEAAVLMVIRDMKNQGKPCDPEEVYRLSSMYAGWFGLPINRVAMLAWIAHYERRLRLNQSPDRMRRIKCLADNLKAVRAMAEGQFALKDDGFTRKVLSQFSRLAFNVDDSRDEIAPVYTPNSSWVEEFTRNRNPVSADEPKEDVGVAFVVEDKLAN